jgi:hypothetical protein
MTTSCKLHSARMLKQKKITSLCYLQFVGAGHLWLPYIKWRGGNEIFQHRVFFQRLRVDADLRRVGAHLSVRLPSDQRLAPPDVSSNCTKSILLRQTGINDRRSHSWGKLTPRVVEGPQCKKIFEPGIDGLESGVGTL